MKDNLKENKKKDPENKSSGNKFIVICTLCLVNLIANTAYSSIAPIFPAEANDKGIPVFYLGFIIAGYSVSMWIFSPIFSLLMSKYGRKKVLMLGCILESFSILVFAFLINFDDPIVYGVSCFLCRMVEGFGNGCLNSSSNSLISYHFEDDQSKLIGLIQTFTGIGMLAGPVGGSFLYSFGGFQLPFFVSGGALFLLVIPVCIFISADV